MRCLCSSWALLKKCFNFLCLCLFQNSDLASGALRRGGLNSLAHLDVEAAGAYVPPRFMARVHAHIVLSEPEGRIAENVARKETQAAPTVDFDRVAKDATNNVRDCLMRIEVELLAVA